MYYGTVTGTSIAAGGTILFSTQQNTNDLIAYSNGVVSIKSPGYYRVHFDASVAGTGNIVPTLVTDNVVSTKGVSTVTSSGATDFVSTAFDTVVFVRPALTGYSALYIINNGVAAAYEDANLIVERIR